MAGYGAQQRERRPFGCSSKGKGQQAGTPACLLVAKPVVKNAIHRTSPSIGNILSASPYFMSDGLSPSRPSRVPGFQTVMAAHELF